MWLALNVLVCLARHVTAEFLGHLLPIAHAGFVSEMKQKCKALDDTVTQLVR